MHPILTMKREEAHRPHMLRLVNTHDAPARRTPRKHHTSRITPGRSDYRSSTYLINSPTHTPGIAAIAADDPRWVFAARVSSQIEGGRAAIIRPERRERLMRTAKLLGLRAFDATLIIALVQDATRRGETRPGYPALTPALASRLSSVPKPDQDTPQTPRLSRLGAACLIATGLVAMGILWINGAPGGM